MPTTILIVEDDAKIARLLELELQYAGYATRVAPNGKDGLAAAEHSVDLVLLDVMMPELSGFEVLRRLRGKGIHIPVIMLTARGEVYDKVAGLDLGSVRYYALRLQLVTHRARYSSQILYSILIDMKHFAMNCDSI